MCRRPPRSTRTDTPFPYATLFRSAATMTLGNLAALWQDDVRRLLGWSSVSQTGYGLLAVVAVERSDLALPSLLYFLLAYVLANVAAFAVRSEEHTSELQSLMRISYAVFC